MKTALVRSKDQFENLMDDGQVTPSEYAEDKIKYAAEDVADRVSHDVSSETKKAVNKGKEAYRKHREEKRIEKNEERVNRYIETGVIPKYAGCVNGVNWFKDRGQWADNDIEPAPGMIIFFDWDNKGSSGPQDGESDHTGIVERVEDGIVYTVEGNSGDSCRENHYAVGYYEILGYGIPAY